MPRDQFYDLAFAVDMSGVISAVSTARATVYNGGTLTTSTIYIAESGATPQTNPWIPGDGIIIFWADSGNYDVKIEDTAGSPAFATRVVRFSSVSGGANGLTTVQLPSTIPSGNLPLPFTASQLDSTTVTTKLWSIGDIKASAASSPQTGWILCDGTSLPRTGGTYDGLFSVLSTTFGAVDGTHFNVPDLRGRTIIGVGSGSGLTTRALNASGGEETHALSTAELAVHAHGIHYQYGSTATPNWPNMPVWDEAGRQFDTSPSTTPTENAGSGSGHQNMQPYKALNYFIKY